MVQVNPGTTGVNLLTDTGNTGSASNSNSSRFPDIRNATVLPAILPKLPGRVPVLIPAASIRPMIGNNSPEKKTYHTGTTQDEYMRFCTTCGKEVAPGKKFCEYCGAPLEQPAPAVPVTPAPVPATTVPSPAAPVTPSGGSGKTLVIGGILVILVLIAGVYFIGMPMMKGSSGSTPPPAATLSTPSPSLYPTTVSGFSAMTPGATTIPAAGLTYDGRYMETYTEVYSVDRAFIGGQKLVFNQDLTTPPLSIKFNITPEIYYGEKTVDIGLSSERVITTNYTSPNAWFKVKVYDAGNGGLVEEQGFNKEHSIMTKQEFMVRTPGNYRIEMSGNEVIAEIRILTGKAS